MNIRLFQVDAFTREPFTGNPAAVCPLESWLPDDVMQSIALENNLSETAFFVPTGRRFHLRWFTPKVEIDLCGHATLASACVIHTQLGWKDTRVEFESRSGLLSVERANDLWVMDFPTRESEPIETPEPLRKILGRDPLETRKAVDLMAVIESEAQVREFVPDFSKIVNLETRGLILTAPGDDVDFVSRFFAPAKGVNEDPVTGSSHCTLIPYWGTRLGKKRLHARQVSTRGGELFCEWKGDRVAIGGHAVTVMEGKFYV
jgi:PhzF family phenazine biosynthesis protein